MSVYKDAKGTWYVKLSYKDFSGKPVKTTKRGFTKKAEAIAWERNFYASSDASAPAMTFKELVDIYRSEHFPRIKDSTHDSVNNIIDHKLLPVFGPMQLKDITPEKIIRWQNSLLQEVSERTGKPLKASYVNKLTDNLGSILEHAHKYYGLDENPAFKVDSIRDIHPSRMQFWTTEEFLKFSSALDGSPIYKVSFDTLYWSGIREGELMALTWDDIDFEKSTIVINKTMRLKGGTAIVTSPKTEKSNRTVIIPAKLLEEIKEYKAHCIDVLPDCSVFPVAPYSLFRQMRRTCLITGQKPIRIHDLRHSHVSLLIHLGYSAIDIAERMGHESTDITFHYAHLFPSVQDQIASDLEKIRKKETL